MCGLKALSETILAVSIRETGIGFQKMELQAAMTKQSYRDQ